MHAFLKNLLMLLLIIAVSSCSKIPTGGGDNWTGYTASGQASFYADKFQNKRTASGERYTHDLDTAAHRDLPFGSIVKVTNKRNGKSVIVRINDRGPFVKGRIIDLSKSAFSHIENLSSGLINVQIDVVR